MKEKKEKWIKEAIHLAELRVIEELEKVIGEDKKLPEWFDNDDFDAFRDEGKNELRAELREKLNKLKEL